MNWKPKRYYTRNTHIPLWESIVIYIRGGNWVRFRTEFVEVQETDPAYETAPFEEDIVFHSAFTVPINKEPFTQSMLDEIHKQLMDESEKSENVCPKCKQPVPVFGDGASLCMDCAGITAIFRKQTRR